MSRTAEKLKSDIQKSLTDLESVRDEIRLKLHLAGMDLKVEWRQLEKELDHAKDDVSSVLNEKTSHALDEAISKLKMFREKLH